MIAATATLVGLAFVVGGCIGFILCAIAYEKRWFLPWYVWRSKLGRYSRG